jgi:hypothetical protein
MTQFFGVMKYEYRMSIRRRGILVVLLLFTIFYSYLAFNIELDTELDGGNLQVLLSEAGQTIFFMNLFFPVIAGISSADRAVRDNKLGLREILRSTGMDNTTYVLGKYFGVALSMISVELVIGLAMSLLMVVLTGGPLVFIGYSLLAVLVLSAPGLLFITAFSLACPLVMPVRVYQILYTGYWYWGNFLSPTVMPTVSDTLLNASGRYALQAFFGVQVSVNEPLVSIGEAVANILVLLLCAGLVLAAMIAYIGRSERKV